MSLINKLLKKRSVPAKVAEKKEPIKEEKKALEKKAVFLASKVLIAPHTAEKALASQKLNQYVFRVASTANKITISDEIKKNYHVKVLKINVINVPRKTRRVGKTSGFKAGYKKAMVTLASGQTIEMK